MAEKGLMTEFWLLCIMM